MNSTPSLWSFVAHADWVVKTVLLILIAASVFSWTLIITKFQELKAAKARATEFNRLFWSGISLNDYFQSLHADSVRGLARMFHATYHEFKRLTGLSHMDRQSTREALNSVLTRTREEAIERLEANSQWLATIGSVSPYVGLFGTVWGIMTSFQALGSVQSASISMVAPGIAEALIATAVGLFAAIPAVIAYNRLSHSIDQLDQQFERFQTSFSPILLEHWSAQKQQP